MRTAHAAAQKRGARDVYETGERGTTTLNALHARLENWDTYHVERDPRRHLVTECPITAAHSRQHKLQRSNVGGNGASKGGKSASGSRTVKTDAIDLPVCLSELTSSFIQGRPRESSSSSDPWLSVLKGLIGTPSTVVKRYDGADQNPEDGGQSPYLFHVGFTDNEQPEFCIR